MSGILAIYSRHGHEIESRVIDQMLAAGRHRGVDGHHIWQGGPIALAHQHHWITPEEQGEQQPLVFQNGDYVISFDGRLDNRPQLEESLGLQDAGRTLTDAHLTLLAYLRWGKDCASHLLGDFAFALWDAEEAHVLLVRDPLGVRQLCYFDNDNCCVVASTVRQILAHPQVPWRLNEATIAEYLVGYTGNQHETHFEGVYFCPPGHCVLLRSQGRETWRYWRPDLERRIVYRDRREYAEELHSLLSEAVRARLRYAGGMGIAMSGGMDSTTVTALAHQELAQEGRLPDEGLRTYSYRFDEYVECDERVYVEAMVERFGLRSTYLSADHQPFLTGDEIPMLSADYVLNMGGTFLPWRLLEQMQQDGRRLQLTGGFGDMLFDRQSYWAVDMLRDGRWSELMAGMHRDGAGWREWVQLGKNAVRPYFPRQRLHARNQETERQLWRNLGVSSHLLEQSQLSERIGNNSCGLYSQRIGVVDQLQVAHWSSYIRLKAIINDWATRLGIEIWEPFRDRRLFEYSLALPAYILGDENIRKRVLREAMSQQLPEVITKRRSVTTLDSWLEGAFWHKEWFSVRHYLMGSPLVLDMGFVPGDWLSKRIHNQSAAQGIDWALWRVLMLEIWLRRFGQQAGEMAVPMEGRL